jgi:putative MATE family efflux protein
MSDAPAETAPPMARLRGDLTQGPILKTLLAFSIPTLISNLLQTLNGTINSIWVGRLIGNSALAATANVNIVMFLTMAAVFGFGMATTVRVGQHFGARDIPAARATFGTGVGFCLMISVVVGLLGWLLAGPLLNALGTPGESRNEALDYLTVTFLTLPLGTLSIMVAMGLRGMGNSKLPLYAMILTVAIDIVMNPFLIRGIGPIPALGITGSALSTAAANFAGCVAMLGWIYWKDLPLRLRGAELGWLWPRRAELAYVITKGLPMGAQMLVVSSAGVVMVRLVNHEGAATAAAYGAALQLWNYLQMPAFAIASGVSAMVAQNIGAGQHERVKDITWQGLVSTTLFTVSMAALMVVFARAPLVLFLGSHSPALPIATHMQAIATWSYALTGIMMILSGTMRAYGAVITPLVVIFTSLYPVRLGFYYAAYHWIGSEALWWAYPVGSAVSVALMIGAYMRPGWREKVLQRGRK